jgi:cytochrome c oxidase subunit 2
MARFPKPYPAILITFLSVLALGILSACSSPQNTFDTHADAADNILTIYIIVLVAASLVGAAVLVAMAWLLIKFRDRPGAVARQIHGNIKLEIAWTIAPIFVLLIIGIPTMFWVKGTTDEPDADVIEVLATGHQWWFEFEYPGLGPDGESLFTANELRVPVGRQVAVTLESDDVIHSFWVPQLVGKTDMVPGNTNHLQKFTPGSIGSFYGQCAEFCGSAHALMRFRVHVDSLADWSRWVASMNEPPAEPEPGSKEAAGKLAFAGCSGCHTIQGTTAQGKVGPDLTLLGDRSTLAAGIMENTDENLTAWIKDVRSIKPIPDSPRFMPSFTTMPDETIENITAYLRSSKIR